MKTTNHLTPTTFYNDFLDYLVLLEPFHSDDIVPPMSANQFYWMARIQFGTASRISETLNSVPSDYDFDHRIFTIRNPKSNKGGVQKTTILPYDIKPFEKFCNKFSDNERMFPITRSTAWKYYKNASILGGLKLCGIKDVKIIDNAWTHLLRSSCAVMYEDLGAKESLIARKMRHSPSTVTQVYTKVDLQTVLDFEDEKLSKCTALPMTNRSYEMELTS